MSMEVFLARARELRRTRRLIEDDGSYPSATALLAVHSAIALNDALLFVWSGSYAKGEDHRSAARATEAQCRVRALDASGVKHLSALIANKSRISYGSEAVSQTKAATLALASKRFEAWTFMHCKEIAAWERQQPL